MKELDKLRVVLPHWIDHNIGHGREFEKWGETLGNAGEDEVAELLKQAASMLRDVDETLRKALHCAGGPLTADDRENSPGHHGHHHHDH